MRQTPVNPPENALGSGVDEAGLAEAITRSGYPLQTVVARLLRQTFGVQVEWAYVDPDSEGLRAIDLLCRKDLWDWKSEQPRVRPVLDLIIECKQSQLPYIFFLSDERPRLYEFPYLAGLFNYDLKIATDDSRSTWSFAITHALDMQDHPFIHADPQFSSFFSKVVRKGSDLELSGTDAFFGLMLPLLKALRHFRTAEQPPETAHYFDCHICIGVGVLDAPLIGVTITESGHELVATPWVRVTRHEYLENEDRFDRSRLFAIDVVHRGFLDKYIPEHVLPFGEEFARRVLRHPTELAVGKGFVTGMEKNSWRGIEPRLKPRRLSRRSVSQSKSNDKGE